MRKSLLAVLLAVAMVAPVFAADEGAMELDVKVGFNLMSNVDVDYSFETVSESVDPAFTAGVDFFYYVMPQLAIGAGVQYVFNSEISNWEGLKAGWTNLYAQAKYVFETGNDIFNNVYPLVQIGYGILRMDPEDWNDVDSNGLYWGIGAGTTIKENFVFELLYSNNNAVIGDPHGPETADVKYSTLQLKVGYKFVF
ncbi:outer membrane beta-barrel protein [Candidatus Ruminimicrobiellum ovillum]|uniref:outer membrane beta-barrel protein n=1 Tax=Candidatus Ruminimicrobiellum ovillum TaxID=1947927 RepID=UPI003559E514